ncbi:MAG: amidohydrolase family protein [bacterium]|nr:amidohydrolase family protein [bacterium]
MTDVEFIGAHLVPSPEQLLRLQRVAAGAEPADLAIRDGTVLALHGRELLRRDVLVCGPHIAAVTPPGRLAATSEIDASGCWVSPGFIDTHLHIEYTLLTPGELARLVVPRGTTTVLADPNCLANVLGPVGMDIAGTTGTPLRIFRQVSHKVPRTPALELGGGTVPEAEILARLSDPLAVTLGESNPFDLEASAARKSHRALAAGRRITGHTARIAAEPLWAYAAAGIFDDHNAFDPGEVIERLRLGIGITVMSGSMNDNVRPLFADPARVAGGFDQFTFCADDRHVGDLADEGHIDHHVRTAIDCGVEPIEAYRMATLNAARSYRLDHVLGSITPTRLADLMLLEDLTDVRPRLVLVGGEIAGRDGAATFANDDVLPESCRGTVRLHSDIGPASFRVEVTGAAPGQVAVVRAMEMYDGYFKRAFEAELAIVAGSVAADPDADVAKIAVVDRHHATRTLAMGFVRGFGLRRGAIGITTNCENQNLVVLGTTDDELADAARALEAIDGGYVVVARGDVLASLPLPYGGCMSDRPWEEVYDGLAGVTAAARSLGCEVASPFMILSFVGLAGVPDYGLTEKGLIDAYTQTFLPVLVCCRCPAHAGA